MPIPTDIGGSPSLRIPAVYARAAANTTVLNVELAGTAVVPTAGTFALYNGTTQLGTTAILGGGALSPPTKIVAAIDLPDTLSFGEGYREVWSLTIDGLVQTFTRPVVLARYPYHCPVVQTDLTNEYPDLNSALRSSTVTSLQVFIDSAHADIVRRLMGDGVLPETMVDTDASFDATRALALSKVFRAYSLNLDETSSYARLSREHMTAYERAYATMRSRVDLAQDGAADTDQRTAMSTILARGSGPLWPYGQAYTRRRVI